MQETTADRSRIGERSLQRSIAGSQHGESIAAFTPAVVKRETYRARCSGAERWHEIGRYGDSLECVMQSVERLDVYNSHGNEGQGQDRHGRQLDQGAELVPEPAAKD